MVVSIPIGLLLITSLQANITDINRLLFALYDWDNNNANVFWIPESIDLKHYHWLRATEVPINGFEANEWAGKSIAEIEELFLPFPCDLDKHEPRNSFIVLDDKGLAKQNVLWMQRASKVDDITGHESDLNYYHKCRIPLYEILDSWTQSMDGNRLYEEVCTGEPLDEPEPGVEESGPGWWKYYQDRWSFEESITQRQSTKEAMAIWEGHKPGWEEDMKKYLTKHHSYWQQDSKGRKVEQVMGSMYPPAKEEL